MTPFPRALYAPLTPYAPDRRPVEVDLSDNTNRWGAHPGALAAVRKADPEELLRYPPVYADRLRAAVAARFGVPLEAVATGCGSDDLLDSAFRAAADPGEAIRFIPPTFSMIEIFARMNGVVALPLEGRGAAGPEAPFGPLPEPGQLLDTEEGTPAILYLCRPNNPTGEVLPRPWVEALLAEAGPSGPVILIDEAYADFMEPVEEPDALLQLAAASPRLVVLRTLSKAFGLAGLRAGFAVGAPEVIREIEKSRGPYKVNRLAEAAAVAALDDAEGWIPGILEATRSGRSRLRTALEERGLAPLPSGANFLLVPTAGIGAGDAASVTAALREAGVAVRPFPALPGLGDAVRVTIGPPHELDRFLEALDRLLPPRS
jgi:histidinol-phosphate aminotransferase